MRVLDRPVTFRHLLATAVAAIGLTVVGTAAAIDGTGNDEKVSLGSSGGYKYRFNGKEVGAGEDGSVKVKCPSGTAVTGGGGKASSKGMVLRDTVPFDHKDANTVPDDGWRTAYRNPLGSSQTIFAYAICR